MLRIRSRSLVMALVLAAGAAACGSGGGSKAATEVSPAGDIPDNQAFVAFSPATGAWAVKVPEGWARTDSASGATFTDKLNSIDIVTGAAPVAPTVESVRAADVPDLQHGASAFELRDVQAVTRAAGPAVLVTYRADSRPDPVTAKVVRDDVERYTFWKDGQQAVLTLIALQGSDNVDPWRIVTDSFRWR